MSGRRRDLTEAQLDEALGIVREGPSVEEYERAFGTAKLAGLVESRSFERAHGRPDAPVDERVAALVEAGLTERSAERVLAAVAEGRTAEQAVLGETVFGVESRLSRRDIPVASVRRRAVEALAGSTGSVFESDSEPRQQPAAQEDLGDERALQRVLREALTPRYRSSADGVAAGALAALRETAVREGLTRQQYVQRAHDLAGHIRSKGTTTTRKVIVR